MYSKPETQVST